MLRTCTASQLDNLLKNRLALTMVLALAAILVYVNSFPGAFIQDDLIIVKNNPLVQAPELSKIFTRGYWWGFENNSLYRPLTILSLALNRMLTGPEPWGFLLVNVLLHAGVTVLVWLTLSRWGASTLTAFLAALLFALHPLHAEVVNEAVGRSELLVALFALLALYVARGEEYWRPPLAVCSFALALLSKEHAVVVLALIPLADAWHGGFPAWRRRFPLYLGMLLLAGGWLLLRSYGVEQAGPSTPYSVLAVPLAYLPWESRVLTALQFQWVYLGKLLWPFPLHAAYSLADLPPVIDSFWSLRGVLVTTASLGVAALLVVGWRRRWWWALPVAAYLVAFAPTANIFMPIGVTMAERLAYFPSIWFCGLLGYISVKAADHGQRWLQVSLVSTLAYLLVMGLLLGLRNRDFASEIALWQREVLVNQKDFLAWHSYAQTLGNSHRYEEAELAYLEMLRLEPDFQGGQRSYFTFLFERGRYREAIAVAEQTLALSKEQRDLTGVAYDQVNLAAAYLELKDFGRAASSLKATDPAAFLQKDIYYSFLGKAYQGLGNHQAAVAAFDKIGSYELDLNIPLYYGISLFSLGRYNEAREKLREATLLNERAEAWNLLGTIAAQEGNYPEAIDSFSRAVERSPGQRHYQENLARARQLSGLSP